MSESFSDCSQVQMIAPQTIDIIEVYTHIGGRWENPACEWEWSEIVK